MIDRILSVEQHKGVNGLRICFSDDQGRQWFVTLNCYLDQQQAEALVGALRAMDLMARDPEKAVQVGMINQESLDQANKFLEDKLLRDLDKQAPAKKWMM